MANFMKRGKKWQARISWRDSNGKLHQKSKSGFATKQQARQYAVKLEQEQLTGTNIEADPTLLDYFSNWYEIYKKPTITEATQRFFTYAKNIIKKYFPNTKLKRINRSDYQKFINDYGADHAPKTVKKLNATIRACIKSAVLDGIIPKDFTQRVNLVSNKKNAMHVEYPSIAEIIKMKDAALDGRRPNYTSRYMIVAAIYTGARLGEIMALTWDDIDFEKHTITINKSWDYLYGTGFKPTKTKSSNRTIRVNDKLLKLLSELKANHHKMVFENQFKTLPSSSAVNKTLRKVMKEAGITKHDFHFHSLRHSHVAYLLSKGIDIYVIGQRLGHADISVTMKTYAYLIDEYKNKADDQIEKDLEEL